VGFYSQKCCRGGFASQSLSHVITRHPKRTIKWTFNCYLPPFLFSFFLFSWELNSMIWYSTVKCMWIGKWDLIFTWWAKMRAWSTDRLGRGQESGWLAFPQADGRRETYPWEQLLSLSLSCWVGCNWLLLSFLSFCIREIVRERERENCSGACCVVQSARDSHLVVNKTHTFPTPSSDTRSLSAHHFLFLYGKENVKCSTSVQLQSILKGFTCIDSTSVCIRVMYL